MRNCANCKMYECAYGKQKEGFIHIPTKEKSVLGEKYAICKAGNNETMLNWWLENGDKKIEETKELSCYEKTKIDEQLDNLLSLCNDLVKKKKN